LAVVMTSVTTACGLLCFSLAELAPIAQLGVIAPIGILLAMVYSLALLPALLAYPHLSAVEKLRALWALGRARCTDRRQPRLERITFYQWLKQRGQSERAIQNLWNLLVEPTLNDNVREVSAAMGLMIVQDGMLQGYHSADLGYPLDGLLPALGEPARQLLEQRGVGLRLGGTVRELLLESQQALGVKLASGEVISGQYYVSALPASSLLEILPAEVDDQPWVERLKGLETSPIVNVHLWYDRPVLEGDFYAFVDRPLQWVFNKSLILQEAHPEEINAEEQHICISLSAAWQYIDRPREDLARQFIDEMAEAFPLARSAEIKKVTVVKQRHATFRCLPGAGDRRPGSRTPVANLFLAGEWTDTGWPSTMESAVRSGYNAARAIIEEES
ncbi:MAG: FAD-dependent oxidoreductase, partial [Dehalococcoidia bacterium]